ncbi:MAG: M14 family zinc carboxypeptidase [Gemmatimonadota bacterium]|nr:MAG: M14 family zinc carboxypeptidase [Gemmatimonadota bacterium]
MSDDSTLIEEILASAPVSSEEGDVIGNSREGREVRGFIFGHGPTRVSLIAGCHSDEPVGPALLRRLACFFTDSASHPLLERFEWWIVPHANPDGEVVNHTWEGGLAGSLAGATGASYDPVAFLTHMMRELPGEDIEFCFPRDADDREARPENLAIYDWWRSGGVPFDVHASLHGMAMSAGPYFLLDAAWAERCAPLKARCVAEVDRLGYTLHDVERHGEKGFHRLERGFGTRPDSEAMRAHFLAMGDEVTADRFRPSSMEVVRSFGADCLTVVSEMPLFITPGVGATLGPPDPVREAWVERRNRWVSALRSGIDEEVAAAEVEIATSGLQPMSIRDQMALQWTLVEAAVDLVAGRS